jgi:hypothetical protein
MSGTAHRPGFSIPAIGARIAVAQAIFNGLDFCAA